MGWLITILLAVLIFVGACLYAYVDVTTSRECLLNGYPASKVDYHLDAYCIKRVDQTDIVVPLEDL